MSLRGNLVSVAPRFDGFWFDSDFFLNQKTGLLQLFSDGLLQFHSICAGDASAMLAMSLARQLVLLSLCVDTQSDIGPSGNWQSPYTNAFQTILYVQELCEHKGKRHAWFPVLLLAVNCHSFDFSTSAQKVKLIRSGLVDARTWSSATP